MNYCFSKTIIDHIYFNVFVIFCFDVSSIIFVDFYSSINDDNEFDYLTNDVVICIRFVLMRIKWLSRWFSLTWLTRHDDMIDSMNSMIRKFDKWIFNKWVKIDFWRFQRRKILIWKLIDQCEFTFTRDTQRNWFYVSVIGLMNDVFISTTVGYL